MHGAADLAASGDLTAARGENFPVAPRILPADLRRHLLALYGFARHVDDLGDEPLPTAADRQSLLDEIESQVRNLYAGRPVHHPVVQALSGTVRERQLPMAPLLRLVESNRMDQRTTRYETFAQLVDYCTLSANPVGELVLHVFGQATPHRVTLSDRICTALQLIEHLQDIGQDYQRGRIYLPAQDMRRFAVGADHLARPVATAALRDLVAFQAERAHAWLEAGAPLAPTMRGWARTAVGGYLAGGRAAVAELARAGHDPLSRPVTPTRARIMRAWLVGRLRSNG